MSDVYDFDVLSDALCPLPEMFIDDEPDTSWEEVSLEGYDGAPYSAINYWGGKARHLAFIYPRLPINKRYGESHGGSLVVGLNLHDHDTMYVNDIDSQIFDLHTVLSGNRYVDPAPEDLLSLMRQYALTGRSTTRDAELLQELQLEGNLYREAVMDVGRSMRRRLLETIWITPYSKQVFDNAEMPYPQDPVENSWRFYVRANQSYGGALRNWQSTPNQARGIQAHGLNMPQSVSRWLSRYKMLKYVICKLKLVEVQLIDGTEFIKKHGKKNTTLYSDPPYHRLCRVATNVYRHEMSDEEHIRFLEVVDSSPADIAISGYANPVYDEYLQDWFASYDRVKLLSGYGSERQEVLWTNYDPEEAMRGHGLSEADIEASRYEAKNGV